MSTSDLVASLTDRIAPLERALGEAWWEASTRASPEADARRAEADLAHRAVLADGDAFAEVRGAYAARDGDPIVDRAIAVLHDAMLPHQLPDDLLRTLVDLETSVDARFTAYRADLDGQRVDDNTLLEILRASDDSGTRRAAWEAGKQIGAEVANDVRALARLRNEGARSLGFRDHFALALATADLDETRLFATLDEVDRLTAEPFRSWKRALDQRLSERFGVAPDALAPWHLDDPFFQDPPVGGAVDLDPLFADADLEALTRRTFSALGLDVDAVMANSDLYARDGKSQHAFCIHIDRQGDVRVLANVESNERWADTMLHEFGHAVYDRGLDGSLPWLVREPAHALTTEGIAMMFGRLVREPEWLREVAGVAPVDVDALAPQLRDAQRAGLLVFARWVLVVTHFERLLYGNPDADLHRAWWDLVERFQLVRRPDGRNAPDWAAKIHLAVVPVYYQNYLYGEMFASQLLATLRAHSGGIVDRADAGARLRNLVFRPGASARWDRLVESATGAPLSARAFAVDLSGA
jgi:peptidyl-dipeptidase A